MIRGAMSIVCQAMMAASLLILNTGCTDADAQSATARGTIRMPDAKSERSPQAVGKTGVLLVSHGSHSPQWRQMLLDFHDDVAPELLEVPKVGSVKSAFMEYTEPSIASQLRAFDEEGYESVILVPLLLTVSSHSFDDIPTIVGMKEDAATMLTLKAEGIDRYKPRSEVHITPLLDFHALLESNLPRRIAPLSRDPSHECVILVAYGSQEYDEEWEAFFERLDKTVVAKTGVAEVRHCWCGHIVHYSPKPTADAIRSALQSHERVIVIPVLVARDEYFQEQVIATAVKQVDAGSRVSYVQDAILPDDNLKSWVISAVRDAVHSEAEKSPDAGERQP